MEIKQTSKEDYLKKFLEEDKEKKHKKKKTQKQTMKVFDLEEADLKNKDQSDDDVDLLDEENLPLFIETAESSKYSMQERRLALARGAQEQDKIRINKSSESSASSSSDDKKKKKKDKKSKKENKKKRRHDSGSEPDDEIMKEIKQNENVKRFKNQMNAALGMGEEEEQSIPTKTIHRDELGNKIDISKIIQEKLSKKEQIEELKKRNQERIDQWGKGMKQREDKLKLKQMIEKKETYEGDYTISKQADMELMKQERFNDPMRHLIQKEDVKIAQAKLNISNQSLCRLKSKFPPITNRFDILPGHMWDGVDRGNGAEKKYFNMINLKKDRALQAHEMATADL